MSFSTDWFELSAKGNFEKFLQKYKGLPNLNFLEIGVYEGMATVWLLENILTDKTSKITTIDTFTKNPDGLYERFIDNIEPYKDKISVIKGESQTELRHIDEEFDFIYIDGSHFAKDVLEDAVLSFRLLKTGGIMIFDDYDWNYYPDQHKNPKLGIDAFLQVFEQQFRVLHKSYQVVIEKT